MININLFLIDHRNLNCNLFIRRKWMNMSNIYTIELILNGAGNRLRQLANPKHFDGKYKNQSLKAHAINLKQRELLINTIFFQWRWIWYNLFVNHNQTKILEWYLISFCDYRRMTEQLWVVWANLLYSILFTAVTWKLRRSQKKNKMQMVS